MMKIETEKSNVLKRTEERIATLQRQADATKSDFTRTHAGILFVGTSAVYWVYRGEQMYLHM
jgi:hypothetical protein